MNDDKEQQAWQELQREYDAYIDHVYEGERNPDKDPNTFDREPAVESGPRLGLYEWITTLIHSKGESERLLVFVEEVLDASGMKREFFQAAREYLELTDYAALVSEFSWNLEETLEQMDG